MVKVLMLCWFLVLLQLGAAITNSVDEDKRSLVIVFDTALSRGPLAEQLKKAAISIVKEFSKSGKDRIFYCAFSFNDVVLLKRSNTTDPDVLVNFISSIKISTPQNQHVCPKLSLAGIIVPLTDKLSRTPIVFVITDAPTRDNCRLNELTELIESTKAQINVIRTYGCESKENNIYEKIADISGGLLFDLEVQDINDVLQVLKRTWEKGQININRINYKNGGTHEIPIKVDDTLNKLVVTLTGTNPHIILKDPNHKVLRDVIKVLQMHNIQSIEINHPIVGKYTLVSSSSSRHDINIEGQSTLAMTYGFSLTQPDSTTANSSFTPVKDESNVLLVAVTSGANLIKTLTKAVLKSANHEVIVALNYKSNGNFYTSNVFVPPNDAFKIIVFGLDKDGNIFQRILSTNVIPTRNFIPNQALPRNLSNKIFVGDRFSVVCDVASFTATSIQWKKNNRVIKSVRPTSKDKNHILILHFDNIQLSDAGEYLCTATNGYGTKYLRTSIVVNKIPEITVSPKSITTTEGSNVLIKCNVKNIDSTAVVYWKFNNQRVPNSKIWADHTLTLSNINRKESGSYVCGLDYDRFHKTDAASVTVGEKPKIWVPPRTTLYVDPGKDLNLPCICRGCKPIRSFKWTSPFHDEFSAIRKERKYNLEASRMDMWGANRANEYDFRFNLKLLKAGRDTHAGKYTCEVENDFGKDSLTLTVVVN